MTDNTHDTDLARRALPAQLVLALIRDDGQAAQFYIDTAAEYLTGTEMLTTVAEALAGLLVESYSQTPEQAGQIVEKFFTMTGTSADDYVFEHACLHLAKMTLATHPTIESCERTLEQTLARIHSS